MMVVRAVGEFLMSLFYETKLAFSRKGNTEEYELIAITTFKKSWLFSLVALIMTLTGCTLLNPTMPVKVPLDFSKTGSVAEADFWIPESDLLEATIEFYYQGGPDGRDRLNELVGNDYRSGITVPLKVQIFKRSEAGRYEPFLDKAYLTKHEDTNGFTNDFVDRSFDRIKIKPDNYHLRAETLKAIPELSRIPVKFCLYYFRRK